MIVVDASALADVLLRVPSAARLEDRILDPAETSHAPQLLDLAILQVLRRFAARGDAQARRAAFAIADLEAFNIARHGHAPLRRRIRELRANATAYDAAYLALAETLGRPVVTRDSKLASLPKHNAVVEVLWSPVSPVSVGALQPA